MNAGSAVMCHDPCDSGPLSLLLTVVFVQIELGVSHTGNGRRFARA